MWVRGHPGEVTDTGPSRGGGRRQLAVSASSVFWNTGLLSPARPCAALTAIDAISFCSSCEAWQKSVSRFNKVFSLLPYSPVIPTAPSSTARPRPQRASALGAGVAVLSQGSRLSLNFFIFNTSHVESWKSTGLDIRNHRNAGLFLLLTK